MINKITLKAASRISPRMFAYHIKRSIRNKLAKKYPQKYFKFIASTCDNIPNLKNNLNDQLELANYISKFYNQEYISHIDEIADGKFTFFSKTVNFNSINNIDWNYTIPDENDFHLWRMKLAHMGFICPMLISGTDRHLTAVERILDQFESNSPFGTEGCFSSYWFPYSVSHRILAVLSGYIIARSKHNLPESLTVKIQKFLKFNLAFVLRNIEHELKNNHVERNLAAICLYFNCVDVRSDFIEGMLDKEVRNVIEACILEDGLLSERSAMYQGLAVMALKIFSDTEWLSDETLRFCKMRLQSAELAWSFMTHPDGDIALFNDSWFGEVPPIKDIYDTKIRTKNGILQNSGYARLDKGSYFALMDAGEIGPKWNPGHGHSDFLAVELDVEGLRFVVDPGTSQYSTGGRRTYERSTQSHNGPCWSGVAPVEYFGCFKVGSMSAAHIVSSSDTSVCGVLKIGSSTVERDLQVDHNGISVRDYWHHGPNGSQTEILIPSEWNLLSIGTTSAIFKQNDVTVELLIDEGFIESHWNEYWSCNYLSKRNATRLKLKPSQNKHKNDTLAWSVRRVDSR